MREDDRSKRAPVDEEMTTASPLFTIIPSARL